MTYTILSIFNLFGAMMHVIMLLKASSVKQKIFVVSFKQAIVFVIEKICLTKIAHVNGVYYGISRVFTFSYL